MPRVKRSVASRKRRKKVLDAAKGFVGTRHSRYKVANEAVEHALVHAYRDRKRRKRDDAPALDHPHQRGRARRGALVQPVRRGLPQGGSRARPQGAGGHRRRRPGRLRQDRRAGEDGARAAAATATALATSASVFEAQAAQCESRSPLYADLCRRFAADPVAAELLGPEPTWDAPLRLLGGLHYLVLGGEAAWDDPLGEHRRVPARVHREQGVQTNEVQRSWVLLPLLLRVARANGRARRSTSSSSGRARA